MSKPCADCKEIKKGPQYRWKGKWLCEVCFFKKK